MRIGVFGGSFDPVHKEHVALARAAVQSLGLDTLFIMPAYAPPHKKGKVLSADNHRLEMCRLAFLGEKNVVVSDYEIAKKDVSYTYLTCQRFKEEYPQAELFWLVGTDMLRDFPTWKNPENILSNATLAVCARAEQAEWLEKERADFMARFHKDFAVIDYHGADVSSTCIRVYAAAGEDIGAYVPPMVEKYITENGLYRIDGAKQALSLMKPERKAHVLRVAETAAKRAVGLQIPERKAVQAALLHDCAKYPEYCGELLDGFTLPDTWGEVPPSVVHQFAGAYLAEKVFGADEEVVNAVRYHTSGRENMGLLEKLIFLADMVESGRSYDGVDVLRRLFWENDTSLPIEKRLDACLSEALNRTVEYLQSKNAYVYPLTVRAAKYYENQTKRE